jgi:hypothetical protein
MQQLFSGRITQFSKQCRSQSVWTDLDNTKCEINPEEWINTKELINQAAIWWDAILIHEINFIMNNFLTTSSKRHQYKATRSKNIGIFQMISGLSGKRSSKVKLSKPQFFSIHSKNSVNKVYNHCPNTILHYWEEHAFNLIVCSQILRKL